MADFTPGDGVDLVVRADERGRIVWVGVITSSGEQAGLCGVTHAVLEQNGSNHPSLTLTFCGNSFLWGKQV